MIDSSDDEIDAPIEEPDPLHDEVPRYVGKRLRRIGALEVRWMPDAIDDAYTTSFFPQQEGVEAFYDFYLQDTATEKERGSNAIGYATSRQRRALRRAAQEKKLKYARIPGGGFRVGNGQIVPPDAKKQEPSYGQLRGVFASTPVLLDEIYGSRIDPLPLGDYTSPFFEGRRRIVCWDLNQVVPEELLAECMSRGDAAADFDASHIAAMNPRAPHRRIWGPRLQRLVTDAWTTHPSTFVRVSSDKDALLQLLTPLSLSRIVIYTRNKRLVKAIVELIERSPASSSPQKPGLETTPCVILVGDIPTNRQRRRSDDSTVQFRPAKDVLADIRERPTASVTKAKQQRPPKKKKQSLLTSPPPLAH